MTTVATDLIDTEVPGDPFIDEPTQQVTEFRWRVAESTGPHTGRDSDGAPYDSGIPCPGCHGHPEAGDTILKLLDGWWHTRCAATYLRHGGADTAWLALAHDLATRPSRYGVADTRAITRNLLRLASAHTTVPTLPLDEEQQ